MQLTVRSMKIKLIACTVLLLLIGGLNSSAQNLGFNGFKNEVSLDIAGIGLQQQIHFNIKRSLKKHLGLLVSFNSNFNRQKFTSAHPIFITDSEYDSRYSGYSIGIGFITNAKRPNIPLPAGFYIGLKVERQQGTIEESNDRSQQTNTYGHTSNLYSIIYGLDHVVNNRLTLDCHLEIGLRQGKIKPVELFELVKPRRIYPYDIPFNHSTTLRDDLTTVDKTFVFNRLHLMPRIALGYLF